MQKSLNAQISPIYYKVVIFYIWFELSLAKILLHETRVFEYRSEFYKYKIKIMKGY